MPPTDASAAATGPRSRKGAESRARLLTAAQEVFERVGFLEARIADITEGASMSHGSFYHYFESKEQVFREIAERQEELLTAPAERSEGDTSTAGPEEFDRILRSTRRYLERYRDNARIMGVIEEVSRYDDHVGDARRRRQQHFADRAERSIRRLQEQGLASTDLDPGLAALALGSMVARFAELWFVERWGDYDLDDASHQVAVMWAGAIGLAVPGREA